MPSTDADSPSRSRRPLLIAAVAGGALVVALVLGLALRDDPSGSDASGDRSSTTATGDASADPEDSTSSAPTTATPADGVAAGDAADELPVSLVPVEGTSEAELCSAIVVRLGDYRDAVADQLPSQELLDALTEFQGQIDTQSNDQDWGDRIMEQVTNVRREWSTAIAADRDGDGGAAQQHVDAGLDRLDRAIDEAACPTA